MKRLFLLLIGFFCIISFSNTWASDKETRIILYIGGFGPSYDIKIHGNTVKYKKADFWTGPFKEETFTVSDQEIQIFIDKLKEVGIEKWKKDYSNDEVMDGTGWSVSIKHKDLEVFSGGHNRYPEHFTAYLKAVKTLIGSREFPDY